MIKVFDIQISRYRYLQLKTLGRAGILLKMADRFFNMADQNFGRLLWGWRLNLLLGITWLLAERFPYNPLNTPLKGKLSFLLNVSFLYKIFVCILKYRTNLASLHLSNIAIYPNHTLLSISVHHRVTLTSELLLGHCNCVHLQNCHPWMIVSSQSSIFFCIFFKHMSRLLKLLCQAASKQLCPCRNYWSMINCSCKLYDLGFNALVLQ